MKCQDELSNLNLTDEEQLTLEKEIQEGINNNNKLKSLIEENKIAQEQLKGLRLEKKEQSLIDKNTIEDYQKVIDLNKDKLEKAEIKQLKEENKQRKADRSSKIQDYNKSIKALMEAKKKLIAKKKGLSNFIEETESSLVKKYIRGNPEGARREIFLKQIASGKLSLKDIYSQTHITNKSLDVLKSINKDYVFDKQKDLIKNAKDNPDDYSSKEMQNFIKHVYSKLNSIAKRLGVLKKYGISSDERPFSQSNDIVRNQLFNRSIINTAKESLGAKPILNEDGLNEYIDDWVNAIGENKIKELINSSYSFSEIKPTIRQAFLDIRQSLIKGNLPKINFSNVEFLSDEAYNYMIKKYSDGTVFDNVVKFANKKINSLAVSESTGGRLTNSQWKLDESISDIERKHYQALEADSYGSQIGTTTGRYAREKALNEYGKLALAVRPLMTYLSPLADRSRAVVLSDIERGKFTIGTLPKQLLGSVNDLYIGLQHALGKGDANKVLRDFADIFRNDSQFKQQRYAIEDSPKSENNIYDKTYGYLFKKSINHFHIQDNAYQVNAVKSFSNDVRRYTNYNLEELPKTWRNILKNRYNINNRDWQEIKNIAKDNDLVTGNLFDGELSKKVTAIEINSVRRGMPLDFKISPGIEASIKNKKGYYIASKMLTMFWRFLVQTSYHGLLDSFETKGSIGVVNYAARLMARGFVPNMIISGLFIYLRTQDINKTLNELYSPSGVTDALLGTISRPIMALSSFIGITSTNDLAYQTSTPLARDVRNTISALDYSASSIYDGDGLKATAIALNQFFSLSVPSYSQIGLKQKLKDYTKTM